MVNREAIKASIVVFQLLGVIGVCINHLPITMMKGASFWLSPNVFREPAMWGIGFLFFSSGFLAHWMRADCFPANAPKGLSALAYVARRFWRLAVPAFAAMAADYFLINFATLSGTAEPEQSLTLLLTLSHTWYYKMLGTSSLAEPLAGSNMVWLSANLFFMSIVYAMTQRFWSKAGPRLCFSVVILAALTYAAQNALLEAFSPEIKIWATNRYGADVHPDYEFGRWLFEYAPYAHVASFLCGVALARFVETVDTVHIRLWAVLVVMAIALVIWGRDTPPKYLGVNILFLLGLHLWGRLQSHGTVDTAESKAAEPLVVRLGAVAYELFVLHLLIFDMFVLTAPPVFDRFGIIFLGARVVVAGVFTLFLCFGLAELILQPLRAGICRVLGTELINDRFV